jgi:hypothetical protein
MHLLLIGLGYAVTPVTADTEGRKIGDEWQFLQNGRLLMLFICNYLFRILKATLDAVCSKEHASGRISSGRRRPRNDGV